MKTYFILSKYEGEFYSLKIWGQILFAQNMGTYFILSKYRGIFYSLDMETYFIPSKYGGLFPNAIAISALQLNDLASAFGLNVRPWKIQLRLIAFGFFNYKARSTPERGVNTSAGCRGIRRAFGERLGPPLCEAEAFRCGPGFILVLFLFPSGLLIGGSTKKGGTEGDRPPPPKKKSKNILQFFLRHYAGLEGLTKHQIINILLS